LTKVAGGGSTARRRFSLSRMIAVPMMLLRRPAAIVFDMDGLLLGHFGAAFAVDDFWPRGPSISGCT
jgi:hypothetical protein